MLDKKRRHQVSEPPPRSKWLMHSAFFIHSVSISFESQNIWPNILWVERVLCLTKLLTYFGLSEWLFHFTVQPIDCLYKPKNSRSILARFTGCCTAREREREWGRYGKIKSSNAFIKYSSAVKMQWRQLKWKLCEQNSIINYSPTPKSL